MDLTQTILQIDFTPFEANPKVDNYQRYQKLKVGDFFPQKNDGFCDCGCGIAIFKPKRRWATNVCANMPYIITSIIRGDITIIRQYLIARDGYGCKNCGDTLDLEVDHIKEVCNGGAGLGLYNYQLLCRVCHKAKTKTLYSPSH